MLRHLNVGVGACLFVSSGLLVGMSPAYGDVRSIVNELRAGGCTATQRLPALDRHTRLQRVADTLSVSASDASTKQVARHAGYAATQISRFQFSGVRNDSDIYTLLKQNYCATLLDKTWQHVAAASRGDQLWVVLGAVQSAPVAAAAPNEVLALVNQAHAQPRTCGKQKFTATTPLRLQAALTAAAQTHANDMARQRFLEHTGSNGSTPAKRIARQGYRYELVGENIAAGPGSADEVVSGWLKSPGHCANIMSPGFMEMGVACALNQNDEYGVYWAQVFAAAR